MIRSMTGFGKAAKEFAKYKITVELRSLNSKGADISLRMPGSMRNFEHDLRGEITRSLERGKIELSVYVESRQQESPGTINIPIAKAYHEQLKKLAAELNEPLQNSLGHIIKLPEVMQSDRKEADEKDWKEVMECVNEAVKQFNQFREKEGESIQKDFNTRLGNIEKGLQEVGKLDVKRLDTIKARIKGNLDEILGKDQYDKNRLEQELIFYVEKLDVNEEKVRLRTHLDHFRETMKENSSGRKLNFIGQEIGREINTIGSKANDADMQKIVVMMKDELEKIKEQTNNVL